MKINVERAGGGTRFVMELEPGATKGATIGRDLMMIDSSGNTVIVRPQDILNSYVVSDDPGNGTGGFSMTTWKLINGIPQNIVEIAKLTGNGFAFRNADGTWRLREIGRRIAEFSWGDPPQTIFTSEVDRLLIQSRVRVDIPFDGVGAGVSLGTPVDPELYIAQSDVDPYTAAGYETTPDMLLLVGAETQLTVTPGTGATSGSGRIILDTVPLEGI